MATPIPAYTPNSASPSTLPVTNKAGTDYKMEFLKLLLTQMKYQDPTSTIDSSQMLAQQAQFASLEQMQNMNQNFVTLMALQNTSQATGMLGKTVTGKDSTGANVSGTVTGVAFNNGTSVLSVTLGSGSTATMYLPDVLSVGL